MVEKNVNPKISIIVPVYKVEQYLHRCLDSIVAQTFTDWECILIDDGSPDKSGAICDEYASKDNRFKVIHQENKGVSAARNAGLEAAKGEWIGFVDSDDWIEPNMYDYLYTTSQKNHPDCVICGFFGQHKKRIKKMCGTEESIIQLFNNKGFGGFSFLRLLSAEKIQNIRFDITVKYMEDVKFFYEIFKNCKKIYWDNEPLYHYEQRNDSVTNEKGLTEAAKTAIKVLEEIQKIESGKIRKVINNALYTFYLNIAFQYAKKTSLRIKNLL